MKKIFPIILSVFCLFSLASAQSVSVGVVQFIPTNNSVDPISNLNPTNTSVKKGGLVLGVSTYCPKLTRTMTRGSSDATTGGEVSRMQTFLKQSLSLNDQQYIVSGYFGRLTEKFLKQYQAQNALRQTGRVDLATMTKINSECVDGTTNITLSASPQSGAAPLLVNFVSTNLSTISTYSIDFGDNTSSSLSATSPNISHVYQTTGTYNAKIIQDPCSANIDCEKETLTAANVNIWVNGLGFSSTTVSATPQTGNAPLAVVIRANNNGFSGAVYADFGDGTTPQQMVNNANCANSTSCQSFLEINHTYQSAGTYTVNVYTSNSNNPNCSADRKCPLSVYSLGTTVVTVSGSTTLTPTINSFTASPANTTSGQSSSLSWTSTNVNYCTLSGGGIYASNLLGNSNYIVNPTTTTTYTLSCVGLNAATVTSTVTVTVGTTGSVTVTATPQTGSAPLNVVIRASNFDGPLYADFGDGTTPQQMVRNSDCTVSASCQPSFQVNHAYQNIGTYTVNISRGIGSVSIGSVVVTVSGSISLTPTINSFTASPANTSSGQSSTLSWTSTNVNYCVLSGGNIYVSNLTGNSNYVVNPTTTTTYTLSCIGLNGGYITSTVIVTVGTTGSVTVTVTPQTGVAPLAVVIRVINLGLIGSIYANFGDGTAPQQMVRNANCTVSASCQSFLEISHTYQNPGTYTINIINNIDGSSWGTAVVVVTR